jgi:hypothetical protein
VSFDRLVPSRRIGLNGAGDVLTRPTVDALQDDQMDAEERSTRPWISRLAQK